MKCPKCRSDNTEGSQFCRSCGLRLEGTEEPDGLQTQTLRSLSSIMAPGTLFAGKYKILGELGRGGMGVVYLAEDTTLSRKVALKLLPEERYQNAEAKQRLIREARAAAALDHPYICSIHEVGEAEGRLFFAMEYVEGRSLRERIAQGPIPLNQALQIAVEAAEALQGAHEKGLVHRDIKPANIMLMERGHAKVMDFGLAKPVLGIQETEAQTAAASLTQDGISPGTPAYMSPEQLHGKTLDQRSDIFSFGIVLYEMLTGVHPFKKETGYTTTSAILNEPPRPVVDLIKGAPEPLQQVIDRALAKDTAERYPSMRDVLADLKKVQAGLPFDWRISKFFKPARLAVAVAILAVTVVAAAWLSKTLFFKSAAEALAFQERDWILITDFENLTGDQVFDGSLETALTVGIQQSQYVNVFPRNRVQETLKRMRKEEVKKVDESLAAEIAAREGIKAVLACSIGKIGDEYILTARIIDPGTQSAVFSRLLRAEGKDRVLDALDELARKLRRELGESLAKISRQKVPLIRATTSSLEALKYFTEGKRAPGSTAYKLLQQAVDLDPDFAMAHAELGLKYYIDADREKGEEHFQKALSLLDRLTAREKLWIQAIVEDWRGNRELGIENYKAYVAQYPDDSSAWFRLGYAYLLTKRFELGIEAFQKVVKLDSSSASAFINLASCNKGLEKDDEALAHYEKAFALRPDYATDVFVNNEYGFLLVKMGRIEEAERTFEKTLQQENLSQKEKGRRSLALLNIYFGKFMKAQEHLEEAIRLAIATKSPLPELRDRLYLARVVLMKGRKNAFEKEMTAVRLIQKRTKIEPAFIYLVGRAYARAGRLNEAVQQLEDLKSRLGDVLAVSSVARSNRSDQASFYMLKGEVEVVQKRYGEAVDSFEMGASLGELSAEDSLGYAFCASGNLDKAAEKYQEFLQNSRIAGNETLERWILAHYELAKIYERKGQPGEAIKYYERLLEIWKDADPDLPVVIDTKKRLAALKGA